jgi:hypothetical protein
MNTLSVRIRAVFRPEDPDAITVLRLSAVANDLDTLARVLLDKKEDERRTQSDDMCFACRRCTCLTLRNY